VTAPDLVAFAAAAKARLTGPGGAFELAVQDVRGVPVPVFVNRRARLRDWLTDSVDFGDREYLVQADRRIDFAGHAAAVAALADVLAAEYGVGAGDRVAIFAANSPDWVVSFWAINSLGAIVVAGNAWWTSREAAQAFAQVRPSLVVADGKRAALLDGLDLPVLRMAEIPQRITASGAAELPDVAVDEDDPAIVMYTSGTSGHAKGAVHSHRNLLAVIEYHRLGDALLTEVMAGMGASARTTARRFLMSLPLFHIASLHNLALPRLTTGDTVVIDEGRFEVDRVLRLVEREKITNWAVVPTMAHRLVEHGSLTDYDLSTLAALSINSAPSSPVLKDRVRAAVPTVQAALADSYGLTEASTAATVATAADLAQFPTSVGPPIVSVQVKICDADGQAVADGIEGEIWLRSQFTMLGYWNDPAATDAVLDADGWLHTGDLGSLRDGRLYLASRRSDLILRGGENVYPAEIEAVLDEHPDVTECAVFGVDDPDLGQAVAAVVVTSADVTQETLRVFATERLAYYKVPALWRLTSEPLARTATGKVVRRALSVE
jgi:acyl-CoA synthetase (AMP-forming)/AMP-acid ligase II